MDTKEVLAKWRRGVYINKMNVLVTSFGSIGKRHVKNLLGLGVIPHVVTKFPDDDIKANFINKLEEIKSKEEITHAIICSPTGKHLDDIKALSKIGVKNFLVEKPIEKNIKRVVAIEELAANEGLNINIAYNMRYLSCFNIIKEFIRKNLSSIRLVNIACGQYLPEWRPGRDYRKSYSASEEEGGGVSLDLSHEIDYMLWLFGVPAKKDIFKARVSSLDIKSHDVFYGLYEYDADKYYFVANIELDYLKKQRERYLQIKCENGNMLCCDFIGKKIKQYDSSGIVIDSKVNDDLFNLDSTYVSEVKDFIGGKSGEESKLATLRESAQVLELLERD